MRTYHPLKQPCLNICRGHSFRFRTCVLDKTCLKPLNQPNYILYVKTECIFEILEVKNLQKVSLLIIF